MRPCVKRFCFEKLKRQRASCASRPARVFVADVRREKLDEAPHRASAGTGDHTAASRRRGLREPVQRFSAVPVEVT
jgi:hypothetical protein